MQPVHQSSRLARLPPALQWTLLLGASAAATIILEMLRIPAALLIGPMLTGIVFGVNDATVRVPAVIFILAQGVVGCLIARSIAPDMLISLLANWPVYIAVVLATLVASSVLGAMISRWGSLPGTTALWGTTPGAASAMVVMADAFGADSRLVAFMQYLRMIFVSLSAATIARFWVDLPSAEPIAIDWLPVLLWPDFAVTLCVAFLGALAGGYSRFPGAALLAPLILGIAVHLGGGVELQLPEWLLAASYAAVGWSVGLRFTRPILRHAAKTLPQIVASIVVLIAFCAALGGMLSATLGVDPLTAFLATSPGGLDSVAIIAAASGNVDLAFVMTLQVARLLIVLLLGPPLARMVAHRMKR